MDNDRRFTRTTRDGKRVDKLIKYGEKEISFSRGETDDT